MSIGTRKQIDTCESRSFVLWLHLFCVVPSPLPSPVPCRQTPLSVLEEECHSVSKQKLLARFSVERAWILSSILAWSPCAEGLNWLCVAKLFPVNQMTARQYHSIQEPWSSCFNSSINCTKCMGGMGGEEVRRQSLWQTFVEAWIKYDRKWR